MNPNAEYQRLIETTGIPLQGLGLADRALNRANALFAVGLLRTASIPILGGDVYFRKGTSVEIAYANWYSDRASDEDRHRFVMRSCLEAEDYIKRFPVTDAEPIFVFVIDS